MSNETSGPVVSLTDEMVAELDKKCRAREESAFCKDVMNGTILSLLAERAELKRDAELASKAFDEIIRQVDGNIRPTVRYCVNGMDDVQDIYYYCEEIKRAIDSAMEHSK